MILYFRFWNEQVAAAALKITTVDHPRIETTIGIIIIVLGGRTTSIAVAAEVRPKRRSMHRRNRIQAFRFLTHPIF